MKYLFLIIASSALAYAHGEDLFPNKGAIIKRMEYANCLEKNLNQFGRAAVSLFGVELEHILILSPSCSEFKNYSLTDAHKLGIVSARCRWFDGEQAIKIPG